MTARVVRNEWGGVEVATGYRNEGVFLTMLSKRGARQSTVSLSAAECRELATLLGQAATAWERITFKRAELARIQDLQESAMQQAGERE